MLSYRLGRKKKSTIDTEQAVKANYDDISLASGSSEKATDAVQNHNDSITTDVVFETANENPAFTDDNDTKL